MRSQRGAAFTDPGSESLTIHRRTVAISTRSSSTIRIGRIRIVIRLHSSIGVVSLADGRSGVSGRRSLRSGCEGREGWQRGDVGREEFQLGL